MPRYTKRSQHLTLSRAGVKEAGDLTAMLRNAGCVIRPLFPDDAEAPSLAIELPSGKQIRFHYGTLDEIDKKRRAVSLLREA